MRDQALAPVFGADRRLNGGALHIKAEFFREPDVFFR